MASRFHRDVLLPDMERVVGHAISTHVGGLHDEMLSHLDVVY